MPHYIEISGGKILIYPPGEPGTRRVPAKFFSETNAVNHLARSMMRAQDGRVLNSSSCNWPEEYDRPRFDYDAFLARVMRRLSEFAE